MRLSAKLHVLFLALVLNGPRIEGQDWTELNTQTRTLFICLDFLPGIYQEDEEAIRKVIDRLPCSAGAFRLVLVPFSQESLDSCAAAAQRLGGICQPMTQHERKVIGILQAPSFAILDPGNMPVSTVTTGGFKLAEIPDSLLVQRGSLDIRFERSGRQSACVKVMQVDCGTSYLICSDTVLSELPIGRYVATRNTVTLDSCVVLRSIPATLRLSSPEGPLRALAGSGIAPSSNSSAPQVADTNIPMPSIRPRAGTVPAGGSEETGNRYRRIGPLSVGITAGAAQFRFSENTQSKSELLLSLGYSGRINGLVGFHTMGLLSPEEQEIEGAIAGIDFSPYFLTFGNAISLGGVAGYTWLRFEALGPEELGQNEYYLKPYYGASLFVGCAGRSSNSVRWRIGLIGFAVWSEPSTYYYRQASMTDYSTLEVGKWSFGVCLQLEH